LTTIKYLISMPSISLSFHQAQNAFITMCRSEVELCVNRIKTSLL
jgi:hypothetical protein